VRSTAPVGPARTAPTGASRIRAGRRRAAVWLTHRRLRAADVALASYPRSGNTWLRFLLTELLVGEADWRRMAETIPFVRKRWAHPPRLASGGGRLWKTHERYRPEYHRAIYLFRDPRAVLVSRWHYRSWLNGPCSLDDVVEEMSSRPTQHGTWSEHVSGWLAASDRGSVELVALPFERALADPVPALRRCCGLLGVEREEAELAAAASRTTKERVHSAERAERPERFGGAGAGSGHARIGGPSWQEVLEQRHLELLAPEVELWESLPA
jgi:hypothetical protein